MGARIRVKADSIIEKFEKFKIVINKALELENDYNSISRERHKLRYRKFELENPIKNGRDAYYHSLWLDDYRPENFISVRLGKLKSLNDIAKLSGDGFVEVDQSDCYLLDEFDLSFFEKRYKDGIASCVKRIEELYQEIEELENKKRNKAKDQESMNEPKTEHSVMKSKTELWLSCAAFLIVGILLIAIIGG